MALMRAAAEVETAAREGALCSDCAVETETQATASSIVSGSEKVLAMSAAPAGIA